VEFTFIPSVITNIVVAKGRRDARVVRVYTGRIRVE